MGWCSQESWSGSVFCMTLAALESWQTTRAKHLDELRSAHRLVGGPGAGRRWETRAIDEALIVRLAAEFQGFARDLHDLSCDFFAASITPSNTAVQQVVRTQLRQGRSLDRGNAHPSSIGADFGRFGFEVWMKLADRDDASSMHRCPLEALNTMRNAFAHAQGARAGETVLGGPPSCTEDA